MKIMNEERRAVLACIMYRVSVVDRQVIFEQEIPVHGCYTRFAFERPRDINETPGIWYMVHHDASSGAVPASHLVQAIAWCEEHFGKSFEPYKGGL